MLEWNKAFERIGFRNALVVRQQADADEWDTLDARHASIRWFVGRDAGMAVGPHQSDPRTGEIIDADIAMSDVFGRSARRLLVEDLGAAGGDLVHHHSGAAVHVVVGGVPLPGGNCRVSRPARHCPDGCIHQEADHPHDQQAFQHRHAAIVPARRNTGRP